LRNDTARLEAKLAEKAQEVENLHNEIGPLKTRIEELEGELELAQGYYEQEQKQRVAIEERYNKFLHRSEQIDPRELEALKKSIEDVQTERDQLAEQVAGLNEQVTNLTQESTELKEQMVNVKQQDGKTHEAAIEEAVKAAKKEQHTKFQKVHQERINGKVEIINTVTKERDDANAQLATVQQELEAARQELSSIQTLSTQSQEQVTALRQEKEQLQAQLVTMQQAVESANAARDQAVAKASASGNADADVSMGEEGQVHENENPTSDEEVANLQKLLDATKNQLAEVQNRAFSAENDYAALKITEYGVRERVTKLEKDDVSSVYGCDPSQPLTYCQAEKGNRIVELQEQLTAAQNQVSQASSEAPVAQPSNDQTLQAEIEKLKQELSEAHEALAESKAANAAKSAEEATEEAVKPDNQETDERSAAILADIEQREAQLKSLEESLALREGVVTSRLRSSQEQAQ
jgi:nucleoprotein TPR